MTKKKLMYVMAIWGMGFLNGVYSSYQSQFSFSVKWMLMFIPSIPLGFFVAYLLKKLFE